MANMNASTTMSPTLEARLAVLQGIIGYRFTDIHLVWEALQAAGSPITSTGTRHILDGNKRVALIGDAIMKAELHEQCYDAMMTKGQATTFVNSRLSNDNLGAVGRRFGIDQFIRLSNGHEGGPSLGMIATTVEAIAGAAYKDGGIDSVREIMTALDLNA